MKDLTLGRSKIVLERGFTPLKTIIEAYASNGHTEFSKKKILEIQFCIRNNFV